MADWASLLAEVFAAKGSNELKAKKSIKKTCKAAAKANDGSRSDLEASLQAFLSRGEGGFRLQGSKIVRAPVVAAEQKAHDTQKKKKKEKRAAAEAAEEQAAAAAAAADEPAKKKKKKRKHMDEAEVDDSKQQQQQAQREEAEQETDAKKGKKRKAAAAAEAEIEEQQQDVQQAANAGRRQAEEEQEEQELPSGKRRKKKAQPGGAAAGTGGASTAPLVSSRSAAANGADGADLDGGNGSRVGGGGGGGADEDDGEERLKWRDDVKRQDIKTGPFSKSEKDALRQAVLDYAAANSLSTDDLSWLYSSSKSGETKGVWKKIAAKLPHRTAKSVWAAGTRMLHEGNYQGKWTPDEDAKLLQLVGERGRKWKDIGGAIGRMPETCRDRWLAIRLGDEQNKGRWGEEETERLGAAVAEYLAAKTAAEAATGQAGEGEATLTLADIQGTAGEAAAADAATAAAAAAAAVSRRVVLDDIDWNVVSAAVGTRSNIQCLEKWYSQLSPSMVARGEWGSGDDRRLLRALYASGAEHDFELNWGTLVRDRTAAQARRRWRLMLKVVPDHRDMAFQEQVEELVDRYMPQLKERAQQQQQAG